MSTSAKPSHNGLPANAAVAGEFLTFTLGREEYGVDILKVQEIRGYDGVTRGSRPRRGVPGHCRSSTRQTGSNRAASMVPPFASERLRDGRRSGRPR